MVVSSGVTYLVWCDLCCVEELNDEPTAWICFDCYCWIEYGPDRPGMLPFWS